MEAWYVLSVVSGREQEALELLERKISNDLWSKCCILKKIKVFRSGGALHLLEDVMFPGYIFIRTAFSKQLSHELGRSRKFPQFVNCGGETLVSVEEQELKFLQSICGENLQKAMEVTKLRLSEENLILEAEGVLKPYLNHIIKLNLHKRFAVVEVKLFNRRQRVLFGLQLDQDQAG